MSIELVTGYHGEEHVTASQVAAFNRAAISNVDKVFTNGSAFEITMVDANTARIADGDMILQGRHITQPANTYTDLTVASGQSGRWRKDLVVIEYTRNVETGVEAVELKVLQGTAASSSAAAQALTPTVANIETAYLTQFALWMIPINEISVGTPVRQFQVEQTSSNGAVNALIYPPNANLNSGKNLFDYIYPVGSIYMSVNSTNPSSLFGGTWVAWGSGRVPVGINTSDSNFNTVEKTGGSATQSLTVAQLPSHTHTYSRASSPTGGTSLTEAQLPSHSHTIPYQSSSGSTGFAYEGRSSQKFQTSRTGSSGEGKAHTHPVNYTSNTSNATGSGSAHNNLQPYITCYMFKRTA